MAEPEQNVAAEGCEEVREMPSYLVPRDGLFRKSRKGKMRLVSSPDPLLEAPIVDTHAHLGMMYDPALTLARCGYQGMDFICAMTDPAEDAEVTYDNLDEWRAQAFVELPHVFEASRAALQEHRAFMAECGTRMPEGETVDEIMSFRCGCTANIPQVRIACGVHPHNARDYNDAMEERLLNFLADHRSCAVGEVGLDYYYDLSPRQVQKDVFKRQIEIAQECGLPLILHMRDAHDDGFEILEQTGWPKAGVLLHCCSVGAEEVQRWVDRGCYIAFGGAVTFNKTDDIRASALVVPENQILFETDAPYMAPVPFRGIENAPEFTVYNAEYIANLRGIQPGEDRKVFLTLVHDNSLALLNREPSFWQVYRDL